MGQFQQPKQYQEFQQESNDNMIVQLRYQHYQKKMMQKIRSVHSNRQKIIRYNLYEKGDHEDIYELDRKQQSCYNSTMNYFRNSIRDPNIKQYEQINRLKTEQIGDLDFRLDNQIEKFNRLKIQKQLEAKNQIDDMTNRILIDIESKQK